VSYNLDYSLHIDNIGDPVRIQIVVNVVEPSVVVTRRKLDFGLRHPYTQEEGLTCELQNRNPFPVEILFQYPTQK
jgi:hypothetical protein